jgi:hypothetical protein
MAELSTPEVNVILISHCPGAPLRFWPTSCVPSSVAMKNLLLGFLGISHPGPIGRLRVDPLAHGSVSLCGLMP